MKSKVLINDTKNIIRAVALGSIVTLIFTSFTSNIIKPVADKVIPTDEKVKKLSFKNVTRSFLEALLTLLLFFILHEIFMYSFKHHL
jgi:hypothetical protein